VDNGKLSVLTSARREDGFPPKCKTSTGNKLDFRSPSPSQKSALLKVPIIRDDRARLVSSNRECFAHYKHISYFFDKYSLSLYVYTRGLLECLLGFWPLGQNLAGAIIIIFSEGIQLAKGVFSGALLNKNHLKMT